MLARSYIPLALNSRVADEKASIGLFEKDRYISISYRTEDISF